MPFAESRGHPADNMRSHDLQFVVTYLRAMWFLSLLSGRA